MICKDIIDLLEAQSPEWVACSWDNVGLQIGNPQKEIHKIYVAVDATDETIEEAVTWGADMLITHHPMIFKGLKRVNSQDFIGRRVIELVKSDVAYYAMHTNFDILGMADLAASKMQLRDTAVLQQTGVYREEPVGIGKVGTLPAKMTVKECIGLVKEAFDVEMVKVFGNLDMEVTKIAICPGSGKSTIADALRAGAQILVTGDIDHHEGIDSVAQGMAVIDAGHYAVEKIFVPYIADILIKSLSDVEVKEQNPRQPFVYI